MPKRTKLLLILLTISILLTCFTSCSASISLSKEKPDNEMRKIDSSDEATLKFYLKGYMSEERSDSVRKMLDEVENRSKENLNVKLDFEWINDADYRNRLRELILSGDSFDAFYFDNSIQDFVERDLIMDLSKLFPQYAKNYYAKFSEDDLNSLLNKGKLAFIPAFLPRSSRMCAVVRQDLLEKYNITEIENYKDYDDFLKIIKENENTVIPGYISSLYRTDMIFAESFGYYTIGSYMVGKWREAKLNFIPWEQVPEYREAVGIMNNWLKNEYVKVSEAIVNDAKNGKVASYLSPCYNTSESSINRNEKYKFHAYPLYTDRYSAALPIPTVGIAINKKSKNVSRVIEFIEWLQSNQENYDLFMYGLKDENYVLNGERIVFTSNTQSMDEWSGSWAFYNIDYVRPDGNQSTNYKEIYKKTMQFHVEYTPFKILTDKILNRTDTSKIEKSVISFQSLMKERDNDILEFEKNLACEDISIQIDNFINKQRKLGINDFVNQYLKTIEELAK